MKNSTYIQKFHTLVRKGFESFYTTKSRIATLNVLAIGHQLVQAYAKLIDGHSWNFFFQLTFLCAFYAIWFRGKYLLANSKQPKCKKTCSKVVAFSKWILENCIQRVCLISSLVCNSWPFDAYVIRGKPSNGSYNFDKKYASSNGTSEPLFQTICQMMGASVFDSNCSRNCGLLL